MEVLGIFVLLLFWLSMVLVNLFLGIRYKKSTIYKGRVIESIDSEIVSFSRASQEIYETYDVVYEYKGEMKSARVRTNRTRLKPGDSIDVYVYDKNGIYEIQNDIYWRKFNNAAGACIVAAALGLMFLLILLGLSLAPKNQSNQSGMRQSSSYTTNYDAEKMNVIQKQVDEYIENHPYSSH